MTKETYQIADEIIQKINGLKTTIRLMSSDSLIKEDFKDSNLTEDRKEKLQKLIILFLKECLEKEELQLKLCDIFQ